MIEQIYSWLNSGRDYTAGVALYEQYGSSASQKRLLRMNGPTKNNVEALNYELSKLIKGSAAVKNVPIHRPPVEAKPAVKPQIKEPIVTGRRPNTQEADELSKHMIDLMKVRDQLHATLEHVDHVQRGKDARMILELSDEITEGYERLDHYNKHGVLPVKPAKIERKKVDEMDLYDLMKLQQNLRTYVSRYKRLMEQAKTPQKKSEHERRMNTFQLELNDVENKLRK